MSKENQDLLDLCRLNLMEDNIEESVSPDKDTTMKAIDLKKRNLMMKMKRAIVAPDAMERHKKANTIDGVYPWTEAERFQVYSEEEEEEEEGEG